MTITTPPATDPSYRQARAHKPERENLQGWRVERGVPMPLSRTRGSSVAQTILS